MAAISEKMQFWKDPSVTMSPMDTEKAVRASDPGRFKFYVDERAQLAHTSKLKGTVEQEEIKFPNNLGENHPFNYELTEGVYAKLGMIKGQVDKIVNYVWGQGFFTKSKDQKAKDIIDQWMRDVDFEVHGRRWVKQAIKNGFSPLELGGEKETDLVEEIKVLDAKRVFIKRSNVGRITKFQQVKASKMGKTTATDQDLNTFKPFQIAHLALNPKDADDPYGLGFIWPVMPSVNNLIGARKDMHVMLHRKANSPLWARLGYRPEDELAGDDEVADFGQSMQVMTNRTEWATSGDVDMQVLDFGNFSEKFMVVIEDDRTDIREGMQVPAILMGVEGVPEGLANTQMDDFQRTASSLQSEIEKVIETKIFRRVLRANGIQAHVEFEWGQPSQEEINKKITHLTTLLGNPLISEGLRIEAELELAKLLKLDETKLTPPEIERRDEETTQQPRVPGHNELEAFEDDRYHYYDFKKNHELKEWVNFDYSKYLESIIKFLEKDKFSLVRATTPEEVLAGRLTEREIQGLRTALIDGFQNGESIRDIAARINMETNLRDLYVMKDGKKTDVLKYRSKIRGIVLARTETVRASSEGALATYKDADIQEYSWLATVSERTCPICLDLNGRIFEVGKGDTPPAHPGCRCTIIPVVPQAEAKTNAKIKT